MAMKNDGITSFYSNNNIYSGFLIILGLCATVLHLGFFCMAHGQIINYEDDLSLKKAMFYDYMENPGNTSANREKSEQWYLNYLENSHDKDQRVRVYFRLGYFYAAGARQELGETQDFARAAQYFNLAIQEDPEGLSQESLFARTQLASVTENDSDKFDTHVNLFKYLLELQETSSQKGYTDRFLRVPSPNFPQSFYRQRMELLLDSIVISTRENTFSLAVHSPVALASLGRLAKEFPNDAIHEMAKNKIREISALNDADLIHLNEAAIQEPGFFSTSDELDVYKEERLTFDRIPERGTYVWRIILVFSSSLIICSIIYILRTRKR